MTEIVLTPSVTEIVIEGEANPLEVVEQGLQVIEVTGPPGPPGPQGPPGAYVHNQAVPASVWNITHNLNYFPNVTVVDSAGTEIEGEVVYVDANNIVVTFNAGFSGKAYLS